VTALDWLGAARALPAQLIETAARLGRAGVSPSSRPRSPAALELVTKGLTARNATVGLKIGRRALHEALNGP
jgi:hypothetical protein